MKCILFVRVFIVIENCDDGAKDEEEEYKEERSRRGSELKGIIGLRCEGGICFAIEST